MESSPKKIQLRLPYPPSVNSYWRHIKSKSGGHRTITSRKGRQYREDVIAATWDHRLPEPLVGPLSVSLWMYPPDERRRDLDNVQKPIWDALSAAGFYEDDSQIVENHSYKREIKKNGLVIIDLWRTESSITSRPVEEPFDTRVTCRPMSGE